MESRLEGTTATAAVAMEGGRLEDVGRRSAMMFKVYGHVSQLLSQKSRRHICVTRRHVSRALMT